MKSWLGCIGALALSVLGAAPCPAEDFYQGKTITLLVGAPAGSDHDKLAKIVARRFPDHIPGKPTINTDNRSNNAGIDALNAFTAEAPKDGTALHLLMPGMAFLQALGAPGVRYDVNALGYIGNLSHAPQVLATWWVTGFKTIDDGRRREMLLGAVGALSPGAIYPSVINAVLRTRFKTLANYRRDVEVDDAIENTEIGGRIVSWAALNSNQPGWISQKRVNVLTQIGLARHPDLPDAPLLSELVSNDRDRATMTFLARDAAHARAIAAPSGVPSERIEILRRAFDAMVRDADFVAEVTAARFSLAPDTGEVTGKAVAAEIGTSKEIIERVRAAVAENF